MKHFSKILIRPIVTEKMTALQETENKYAFEIPSDINKIDVKKAVEEKFNVKVSKVAISNRKGKAKQMTVKSNGRTIRTDGFAKSKKRAIVTLIDGYNIDLAYRYFKWLLDNLNQLLQHLDLLLGQTFQRLQLISQKNLW